MFNRLSELPLFRKRRQPATYPRDGYFHVLAPFRSSPRDIGRVRINLVLPSVCREHLTGGPATLVNYLMAVADRFPEFGLRLLPVMVPFSGDPGELPEKLRDFAITRMPSAAAVATPEPPSREIVQDAAAKQGVLPISADDVFIASMWPTHHLCKALQRDQESCFGRAHKIQYLIQDYESSAIYPWSDLFLLAEQTYQDVDDTIAVVGTRSLRDYLYQQGHDYKACYDFEPGGNALAAVDRDVEKKEIMVVYGRPGTPRNCFPMLMEALLRLTAEHPSIADRFTFVSLGESHPDYRLNHGAVLKSGGFLPPEDYRELLASAAVGVFMVVSPHTGYVGLEMARHGILTVSNSFRTKDVTRLHPNIRTPDAMTVEGVTGALLAAVQAFWRDPALGPRTAIEFQASPRAARPAAGDFPFIDELFAAHYRFGAGSRA